jgi:cyclopropane fatty-acyl-phospholipid synthase-like methyltransferase
MIPIQPISLASVEEFFRQYNCGASFYNTDGSKNLSVDGTGVLASVDERASQGITNFIAELFDLSNGPMNLLDLGTGVGHLIKRLSGSDKIIAFGLEGSRDLIDKMVCDRSRVVIADLSKSITDERLHRQFHLTTSFEVVEHVHRQHQETFWGNVKYLAPYHLCSIHCALPEHSDHCTIKSPTEWEGYFLNHGFKFVKLGHYPNTNTESDVFRLKTGLSNWDCSAMYLLEM